MGLHAPRLRPWQRPVPARATGRQNTRQRGGLLMTNMLATVPRMLPTVYRGRPIDWWKTNRNRYSRLPLMAVDMLTIPSTSAESERTFSSAVCMTTPLRSRLRREIERIGQRRDSRIFKVRRHVTRTRQRNAVGWQNDGNKVEGDNVDFLNEASLTSVFACYTRMQSAAAGGIWLSCDQLVDDKALCLAVSINLDISLTTRCDNGRVKPQLLLSHQQKPEDGRHKLQPVFVDVKLFRGNPSEPVEFPYSS
jgi:hypothetical protein